MLPKLLKEIFAVSNEDGQALAYDLLDRHGYRVVAGQGYCYGAGRIPVCLVAHTDTVHRRPPSVLYVDKSKRVVWAKEGLGADDRAGVYAIAALLAQGLRPHVLFSDEEEVGGIGATSAANTLAPPPVRCLVQLDRANANDAVYYDCDAPELERWVDGFGWKTSRGTFTDISILGPDWGIAAVNLSVGYYQQHTLAEHVRLDELQGTIRRVEKMLRNPPRRKIKYAERVPEWTFRDDWNEHDKGSWEREYRELLADHKARDSGAWHDDDEDYRGGWYEPLSHLQA